MRVNSITLGRWFHWVRLNITSQLICISENTTYVQQFRAVVVFGVLLSVLVAVWDTVLMKIILLINSVSIINRKGAVLLGPSSLKWETFCWAAIRGHQILIYQTLWPTYISIFFLNTVFSVFYRYLHFFSHDHDNSQLGLLVFSVFLFLLNTTHPTSTHVGCGTFPSFPSTLSHTLSHAYSCHVSRNTTPPHPNELICQEQDCSVPLSLLPYLRSEATS